MVVYAGGEHRVICMYEEWQNKFTFLGLCTCWHFNSGEELMRKNKIFIGQFIVMRPLIALILAILFIVQGEPKPAIVLALRCFNLFLTIVSVQTLVNAYLATAEHLWGFGAAKKFLFIKISVAITIIQDITMAFLVPFGVIKGDYGFDPEQVGTRMISSLIIIEQLGFSLMALWAYGHLDESLNKERLDLTYSEYDTDEDRILPSSSPYTTPYSTPAIGRVTKGIWNACKLVFRLWDVMSPPIEEFPSHFGHEAAITDFAAWGEEEDKSFMERSSITRSTAAGPSIDETHYDDTTPYN